MCRCVCLSESTFKAVQHIFVGNSWIFTMKHIRQILQDIPRRYSSGYARDLFDQLCSKFTMGLGPRARTTNTTPSFSYLAIIWSMSNNKNVPSTNHLHSTKQWHQGVWNKAGVLECICSVFQLVIYVLAE